MKVKVRLYTILKKYGKGKIDGNNYMNVPENMTLNWIVAHLGIPDRLGKVFLVNGFPRPIEYQLIEEDEVKIFSFICGG